MGLQEMINAMNKSVKDTGAREYSLGRFIKDLEKLDQGKLIYVEEGMGCDGLSSWRASYCELALEYDSEKKSTVKEVLKNAEGILDKTLVGYKGGDFLMDKKTPIHIANYGECSFGIPKYGFEFKCENSKDNFMCHYNVKLIGIEDKGEFYQLKLRIDDDSCE